MPYRDPLKRKQYQHNYNLKRRGALIKNGIEKNTAACQTHTRMRIATAEDLRELLETVVAQVHEAGPDLQLEAKFRILLKAVEVGIKIIEITDIAQRVFALEEAVKSQSQSPRA